MRQLFDLYVADLEARGKAATTSGAARTATAVERRSTPASRPPLFMAPGGLEERGDDAALRGGDRSNVAGRC